jgi:arylformamidase
MRKFFLHYKRIYDISHSLRTGFPVWPGDPPGLITQTQSVDGGEVYNSSSINSPLHWGTHIDAPSHLFRDNLTVDQIPPELLLGSVKVVYFPDVEKITAKDLKNINLLQVERILFKTRNSDFWNETPLRFREDFTALTAEAAKLLVDADIKVVGIDYFSLDLFTAKDLPVHKILYKSNIIGIEGLDLRKISEGNYEMICLPVKIRQGDGAPARVLLLEK